MHKRSKLNDHSIVIIGLIGIGALASPGLSAQDLKSTGSVTIAAGDYFDFDGGGVSERSDADIRFATGADAKGRFLEPINRAGLGILETDKDLYQTCVAKVDDLPTSRLNLSLVLEPTYVCVRTSQNQPGLLALDPRKIKSANAISIGFTLWERPQVKPAPSPKNKIIPRFPKKPADDKGGDQLFAPPIDPGVKSNDKNTPSKPAGDETSEPTNTPRDPGDKPGAPGPKGGDPKGDDPKGDDSDGAPTTAPVDPGDKPGAPGPKGDDDDGPTMAPADPGDKPGAPGPKGQDDDAPAPPDFGDVAAQENRDTLACPTPLQVNSMAAGHRTAETQSGWGLQIERPATGIYGAEHSILYFVKAQLDDNDRVLTCTYAYRTAVKFNFGLNQRKQVDLASEAVRFTLGKGTGGQCEPLSGFDEAGLCRGGGIEWQGCPSVGGSFQNGDCDIYRKDAATCQVSCAVLAPQ